MARRLLDSPWPYFTGAALLLLVAVATQIEVRLPARPVAGPEALLPLRERDDLNVVFVLIDTLRPDHLGAYGYERDTSPNIDALASAGILFENTLAQSSWTKTSMASLWTGAYPINHGILHFDHVLPSAAVLPAELFQAAGFRTAGIWRNGWVAPNFGFQQGFDSYVKPRPGRARARIQRGNPSTRPLQGSDEDLVTSAIEFLDTWGNERFFLYLHFMDVHQYVYDDQVTHFGTSYRDLYDQAIHWTDRLVAVLVEALIERDLLDETVIAIAADHGEAFLEHGIEGHGRNLYGEVSRVPFIVIPPFTLEPGVRVDALASNLDVWPTLLDLVGLPPLPGADGRSLVPLILEAAGVAPPGSGDGLRDRAIYGQINRGWGKKRQKPSPLLGVRKGPWQLYLPLEAEEQAELYDQERDPGEKRNRLAEHEREAEEMRALARAHVAGAASPWGSEPETVELNEMQLGQLRALGYLVEQ